MSLEKEEQERHELRKMMFMGEPGDDMRKRDKKKMDDDDSMQFSTTGQPGVTKQLPYLKIKKINFLLVSRSCSSNI